MCEAFGEDLLLQSYECYYIYYNLQKRNLSKTDNKGLKINFFRGWERLKDSCREKGLWIECFYATFFQANISDEYLKNYITLLDYDMDKLSSTPVLQHFKVNELIEETKSFLEKKLDDKRYGSWIQAILHEINGDLDKAIEFKINDYRKHRRPMILVRKLYSMKKLDKLQVFLEGELNANTQNSEIANSLKRLEILKIASGDEKLTMMLEDVAFNEQGAPSGGRLRELYKELDNPKTLSIGVKIFCLFQQLFPLDHEVCKYYAKILEANGQIEEAFRIYDLMLMSGFNEERTIEDIRMITIAALIHDRFEYAVKVFSKLDEMVELQKEINELKNRKARLNDLHKLYMQVNKELETLIRLYEKLIQAGEADNTALIEAFRLICSKLEEHDFISAIDVLLDKKYEPLLGFIGVGEIFSITEAYPKEVFQKIFELKLYIVDRFIYCVENKGDGYEQIIKAASYVERSLPITLRFITDNKDNVFPYIKEAFENLSSSKEEDAVLQHCIDLLHNSKDYSVRKFVMLLMAGLFNRPKNIESIYKSGYDNELSKKLILELSNIYIEDLNKGTHYYSKIGFSLLNCLYINEAKDYFEYAMNNLSEEEKNKLTSTLMYHVCDLLIKMELGIEINSADYEKKSFFAKALLSIVERNQYSSYVSKFLTNNNGNRNETIILVYALKAALCGDYDKAYKELESIRDNNELYEVFEVQINSMSGKKKNLEKTTETKALEYMDIIEEEAAAAEEEPDLVQIDVLEDDTGFLKDFIAIFDKDNDIDSLIQELLKFTPVIEERISQCEAAEKDLVKQYELWSGIIDRYVGNVEALPALELNHRSAASLKAAVAARSLGRYDEFFKYLAEYCEAELERLTRGENEFTCQVAMAYEAHLIWYARYNYIKRLNQNIDKNEKKLSSFHMLFFRAFTLIDDFSILLQNMEYAKRIYLLLSRVGYRFITEYQKDYRDGKEGILYYYYSFADAIEKYAKAEDTNEKRVFIDDAMENIKAMEAAAKYQFFKKDMYDMNAFTNGLMHVCNEEIKKLENKPIVKMIFLNRQDIHANKLNGSFHFVIFNKGKAKAEDFSCTFKILKDKKLLATPYVQERQTLREGEKLPVGFKYAFEEEGDFELSVETKYSDGEFQIFNYSIEIKNQEFAYERISENTYPTAPIDDENKFFGRKAIIQRIKDCLYDESDRTTFLIYGLRRVGKTSLLNHVEYIMKDRFYPIQCDCQSVFDANNTGQLVYQLFVERIADGLTYDYGINIDMPSEEAFDRSPLRELNRFFVNVERKIGDKSLLLLIDEFDEVVKKVEDGVYSHELFDFIRTKMQHSAKTRFIIAGGEYLLNIMKNKALKISDTAKRLEVGFLEPDEAREMMEKPLRVKGIECLPSAVERILMITCRHPYFLTAIGNGVVEILNREKERYVVYPDDVEYVSDKLLDMTQ
ncbi:MAG: AAA family ATPase, partial [Lutispora sp.]|nr:AAA family ATPase [Lutispora sp.]